MSYVQRVLQPDEIVRHTASLHWIVYLPGATFLFLAGVSYAYGHVGDHAKTFWDVVAVLFALIGVCLVIPEWFRWWTTEIVVTNKRVIYKIRLLNFNIFHFLRVETNEMNMDKIESVQIDQSLLGQWLGFGDVTILGTGVGGEPIKTIAAPLQLRNEITEK